MPTDDPKPVHKGLLELLVPPTDHGAQQAQGCLGNWHPSMETGGMWSDRCEINGYMESHLKLGPPFETRRSTRIPIGRQAVRSKK
jgi:hypothetical protein